MVIFIPSYYAQDGTTSYDYIDITINDDGSMTVKEYYDLEGNYNGSYRDINYISATREFKGNKEDFLGSDIYNGSSIENIKIYDTRIENGYIKLNNEFTNEQNAKTGDYGVYQVNNNSKGITIKVFKPSSYKTGFYIEYTVNNVVVVHNDVAELTWKFFGEDYFENTRDLRITINLPNTNENLRAWLHDRILTGNIKLINKNKVEVRYDYLPNQNYTEVRLVFDKSIVPFATKFSNVAALDIILEIEQELADKANTMRQRAKIIIYGIDILTYLWYLGLFIIIVNIYNKYDKEHKPNFHHKYNREFPNTYGPEVVEYLFKKKATSLSISASVLELIRKKHFKVEMINDQDYKLIKNIDNDEGLTESEKYLKSWFLTFVGNGSEVSLKDLKKASSKYETAKTFISSYNIWQNIVYMMCEKEEFYEDNIGVKIGPILYSILGGIAIGGLNIFFMTNNILGYIVAIPVVFSAFYFATFNKRTGKGNEQYYEWKAFKRFLSDFGRFSDKELPAIHLWEKYLVYATALGVAPKLSKVMQLRLDNMNVSSDVRMNYTFLYLNNRMLGYTLTSSINSSINNTISRAVANSNTSSSSGYGGGSSFGGGGFSGGGGGGRF